MNLQIKRIRPLGAALLMVPILCVNWHFLEKRQQEDRLNRDLVNQKMPPSLALTTQAVGPFRGLISNGLWWRAVRLQDEGQHFEAIQLADWISSLQPKISTVWTWQSFNMAYNISINYDDPDEQWKWVKEGISLLRDKGLRYNPRDPDISMELGRLFMEKIGKDAYRHVLWARIMKRYLPEGAQSEIIALSKAPATEDELLKQEGVSDFLAKSTTAGLQLKHVIRILLDDTKAELPDAQRRLFDDDALATVYTAIRSYGARQGLEKDLKMDLDHMLFIDIKYGPFDWRLYQAHVVYWTAIESYEASKPEHSEKNGDKKKTDYHYPYHRQAMVDAFYSGRMLYIDDKGMTTGPNLKLAANIHRFSVNYLEMSPDDKGARELAVRFHEMAIMILYTQMYEKEAREMFNDYRGHVMSEADKKRWTYESFLADRAPKLIHSGEVVKGKAMIFSALSQAFYWAGQGEPYRAKGYENLAKLIYRNVKRKRQSLAGKNTTLPPFNEMKRIHFERATSSGSPFPKHVIARLKGMAGESGDLRLAKPTAPRETLDLGFDAHE